MNDGLNGRQSRGVTEPQRDRRPLRRGVCHALRAKRRIAESKEFEQIIKGFGYVRSMGCVRTVSEEGGGVWRDVYLFSKGLDLSEIRPPLPPPCGRGGPCPSSGAKRSEELKQDREAELMSEGFRYVRSMFSPSKVVRVAESKEFEPMSEGFRYVRTMFCPSSRTK